MSGPTIGTGRVALPRTLPDVNAEATLLVEWLELHAVCREIETEDLASDKFILALRGLLAQPVKPGPPATGGTEAADLLAPFLE
jgi:hypothetical protein